MLLLEMQLQQIFIIIRKGYKYHLVSFNKSLVQEKNAGFHSCDMSNMAGR